MEIRSAPRVILAGRKCSGILAAGRQARLRAAVPDFPKPVYFPFTDQSLCWGFASGIAELLFERVWKERRKNGLAGALLRLCSGGWQGEGPRAKPGPHMGLGIKTLCGFFGRRFPLFGRHRSLME